MPASAHRLVAQESAVFSLLGPLATFDEQQHAPHRDADVEISGVIHFCDSAQAAKELAFASTARLASALGSSEIRNWQKRRGQQLAQTHGRPLRDTVGDAVKKGLQRRSASTHIELPDKADLANVEARIQLPAE
jgi:hypothetical protein